MTRERRENKPIETDTLVINRPIGVRHIQILIDRSGSMESIKVAMQEGFSQFLAEQRAIPGAEDIRFVVTQFDNVSVDDVEVGNLLNANALKLEPRGNTPLYDALGTTIERATARMAKDDVMLFVTITDGQENASFKWTRETVQKLIAAKMAEGWAFIYLGANQDAWQVGNSLGLRGGTTLQYTADVTGTQTAYRAASATSRAYRMSESRAEIANLKIADPNDVKVTSKSDAKATSKKTPSSGRK